MADTVIKSRITLRADTYENWTASNPKLLAGETAVVYKDGKTLFKVGDGINQFSDLAWAGGAGGAGSIDENSFTFAADLLVGAPIGKYQTKGGSPISPTNIETISAKDKTFKTVWNDIFDVTAYIPEAYAPYISTAVWGGNTSDTFGGGCTPTVTITLGNVSENYFGYFKYEGGNEQDAGCHLNLIDETNYCKVTLYSDSSRTQVVETKYAGSTSRDRTFSVSFNKLDVDSTSKTYYYTAEISYSANSNIAKDNLGGDHAEVTISANTTSKDNSGAITSLGKITFTAPRLSVSNTGNITEYLSSIIPANERYFTVTLTQGRFDTKQGNVSSYTQPTTAQYSFDGIIGTGTFSSNSFKVKITEEEVAGISSSFHRLTNISADFGSISGLTYTSKNGYTIEANSTNIDGYTEGGTIVADDDSMTLIGSNTSYSNLYTLPSVSMSNVTFDVTDSSKEYGTQANASASISYTSGKITNSSGTKVNAGETFTKPAISYSPNNPTYLGNSATTASASYATTAWNTNNVGTCYTTLHHECPNAKTAYIAAVSALSGSLMNSASPLSGKKFCYAFAADGTLDTTTQRSGKTTYEAALGTYAITTAEGQYVWILTRSEINQSTQKLTWNGFAQEFGGTVATGDYYLFSSNQTIKISTGKTLNGYYAYRMTDAKSAGTWTYKIEAK